MGLFGEIKCRRCDRRYSAIRSRCPYCGARKKRGKVDRDADGHTKLIIGIVLLAVIVIAVIVLVYMSLTGKGLGGTKATPTPTVAATATPKPTSTPSASPKASATPAPGITPGTTPVQSTPAVGAAVTNITLSRTDITLSYIGETWTLYPTLTPANSTQTVKWTSSDPTLVTVSASGQVAAISKGNATITAEAGGKKASCIVRVTADAIAPAAPDTSAASSSASFTLSHADVTLSAAKKESFTLRALGTSDTPTFRSDNANIATVATDGTVTAVSSGRTTIYVSAGGATLECLVRVN